MIIIVQTETCANFFHVLNKDIFQHPLMSLKVFVPSLLYVAQNNFILLAYDRLDVATYQITYQIKILTTAFFCIILLKKKLKIGQWISLVILTCGVAIVGIATSNPGQNSKQKSHALKEYVFGLCLILASCVTSGFSGVYLEKILKKSGFSIWILNLQLSFYGLILALIITFASYYNDIMAKGFLYGYKPSVWWLVFIQAIGGLVIAFVMKYADNILKGFSTSFSIILTALVSYFMFGNSITPLYGIGAATVILSVVMYAYYS